MPVRNLITETARINENCPEMVDSETLLDSVSLSPDGKLIFYYTMIGRTSESIQSQAFKAYLIPAILENVKYNGNLRMFRDSSITMLFSYLDRNGDFVTEISIKPEQYK